ncbi:MAG: alanine--glyoxylate aminotransferase family protein [Bernardetiaceae bacterium]|nr:alanine--glyoxylate aminotransferase family protein [Bernardetiaceae bacterium]
MLNFYPGPSRVYDEVEAYLSDAYQEGILSIQHRSDAFVAISKQLQQSLRDKLQIPNGYCILYTTSATECWEIINQAYPARQSLHIFNGAFGKKWHRYHTELSSDCQPFAFDIQERPPLEALPNTQGNALLCLTHNETSNGTKLPDNYLSQLRQRYPEDIIAIDATSSLGGVSLPWGKADIWFASVQKCLGMPAGMALLIVSEKAIDAAEAKPHRYNSLRFLVDKMQDFQTTYTPSVLHIYLLMRLMQQRGSIEQIDARIRVQAQEWYGFLAKIKVKLLVQNPEVRSDTVIAISGDESFVFQTKYMAKEAGIILGNGYGDWAKTSLRIANFPAIADDEIFVLKDFLQEFIEGK